MSEIHDICVIGGGLGGSIAAARAADLGRSVVLLEKGVDARYLCNSRMTAGIFHIALRSVLDDPASLEQSINARTSNSHPELAHTLAHNIERAVRFLQGVGVRFMKASPEPHHNFAVAPPARHRNGPFDIYRRGGDVMLRTIHAFLEGKGGQIRYGHCAEELLVEEGRVVGVRARLPDGSQTEIRARHVIIADGGFQANKPMIQEAGIAIDPQNVVQRNARTAEGYGLRMALAVGAKAAASPLGFYGHLLSVKALEDDLLWPYPWLDLVATAGIAVGRDGRRYADESRGGVYLSNKTAANPPDGIVFAIFDEAIWQNDGKAYLNPPNPWLSDYPGAVIKADSISALAVQLGLPEDVLEAEVAGYNAALEAGALGSLTPPRNSGKIKAKAILQAPFYGVPMVAGITYTMGGIQTDGQCRVAKSEGGTFDNLFAVGCSVGGIEGGEEVDYIGGLAKSAVSGMVAAETAAAL